MALAKIRALGIAPYDSLKYLMEEVAGNYEQLDLNVYIGSMKRGVEIARQNLAQNYDVIISRGGTAEIIRKLTTIPVIEINTSIYDILRAFELAETYSKHYAVVGFPSITDVVQLLCDLLKYDVKIVTIHDEDATELTLQQLQQEGYQLVVGDTNTQCAQKLGLNSILITSGEDSVKQAFDQAIKLCANYVKLKEDKAVLGEIIRENNTNVVVFDERENLYFSSYKVTDNLLIEMLHQELPEVINGNNRKIIRYIGETRYNITAQLIAKTDTMYIAFYITTGSAQPLKKQHAINYINRKEALQHFQEGLYNIPETLGTLSSTLDQVSKSVFPVLIVGEEGSGREQIAQRLYAQGKFSQTPLVAIDCALLNEASWHDLVLSTDSPLNDKQITLFFKNIDQLSHDYQRQLLALFNGLNIKVTNRLIFSCTYEAPNKIPAVGYQLLKVLSSLLLKIPSLRERPLELPVIANLYLQQLNHELGKQIIGFDARALELMKHYAWPANYMQLKRVINELSIITTTPYVTAPAVKTTLAKEAELYVQPAFNEKQETGIIINVNQSLKLIDREIINKVVALNNGNQTAAAKKLGICRTTLWKYLNEK